jgi:hypothetical protein
MQADAVSLFVQENGYMIFFDGKCLRDFLHRARFTRPVDKRRNKAAQRKVG